MAFPLRSPWGCAIFLVKTWPHTIDFMVGFGASHKLQIIWPTIGVGDLWWWHSPGSFIANVCIYMYLQTKSYMLCELQILLYYYMVFDILKLYFGLQYIAHHMLCITYLLVQYILQYLFDFYSNNLYIYISKYLLVHSIARYTKWFYTMWYCVTFWNYFTLCLLHIAFTHSSLWPNIIPHYIMINNIVLYYVISYYITLYHMISYCVILYFILLYLWYFTRSILHLDWYMSKTFCKLPRPRMVGMIRAKKLMQYLWLDRAEKWDGKLLRNPGRARL